MAPSSADRRDRLVRWRGAAGVSLLALVSACASQPTATGPAPSGAQAMHRPASYAPPGPPGDPWGPYIREAARRFDVPERWIREVMRQESAGRTNATSPVGAMGLMQVMPGTYAELRYRYGLGDDPYHPYDSIMAGAAYIREMYDLYGSPAFLAAYNAGPRRLEDYLWAGRTMPNETRNYVARIGPRIIDAHPTRRAPPEVYAAAEIPLNIPPGPRRADSATLLALREQRDQRDQRRDAAEQAVQVASLPPGPVVRMDPIPDGSTPPVQVASLAGPVIRMDPIPDGSTGPRPAEAEVMRMDPIPDGSTAPRWEPPAAVALAPPTRPAPSRWLPAPPPAAPSRLFTEAPRQPPMTLGRQQLAEARPPLPPAHSLSLLGTAHAATLPGGLRNAAAAPGTGGWAVQVGAFASESLARAAAGEASARIAALGTRVAVQPVVQGRTTLFRARVTGLSRESAQTACGRLRSRGACMPLSPDVQG